MIQKQAQKNARKCRLIPMAIIVMIMGISLLPMAFGKIYIGYAIVFFGALFLSRFVQSKLIKKCLQGAWERGEYALYDATAREMTLGNERSMLYAEVLDYAGEYQKLINICVARIKELRKKKSKKKRRVSYLYMFLLARVYFRLADYQKLAQICETFRTWLQNDDYATQRQLTPYQSVLETYELYMQGDAQGVLAHVDERDAEANPMVRCGNLIIRARVAAELQNDTEAAAAMYAEVVRLAPMQVQREFAQKALENIQQGLPYGHGNPEVLPDDSYALTKSAALKRVRFLSGLFGGAITLLWVLCILLVSL